MSTTQNIKESVTKEEYPAPKNHQVSEATEKKLFSSKKICFLTRVQELRIIQEVLRRNDEPLTIPVEISPAHCLLCKRVGFVNEVPV